MKGIKRVKPKKIETVVIPPAVAKVEDLALSKSDPLYYSKIGKISAKKRKQSSEDMAEMAKLSHPRKEYRGGRKKKTE